MDRHTEGTIGGIMETLKTTNLYIVQQHNDLGDVCRKLFTSTLDKYGLEYSDLSDESYQREINKEIPYERQ
jgi:hypothetical protein